MIMFFFLFSKLPKDMKDLAALYDLYTPFYELLNF